MSLLGDIENSLVNTLNKFAPLPFLGGAGSAAKAGVGVAESGVKDASTVISDAGGAISSVGDFLSYVAWIFHPLNILRAVEFIAGMNFFLVGIYVLTRSRSGRSGATSSPIVRRAIQASPAGRVIRVRQGTRMGRYEGQRETARMEARQAETLSQRQASANERVQINRNARTSN